MTAPNTHEAYHREQKCRKMAKQVIIEATKVLAQANDSLWQELANRAQVNRPSEESRRRIIQILGDLSK